MRGMNSMVLLVVGAFLTVHATVKATDLPPRESKPLSEIVKSVEDQKLGVITEVDFDDGFWEVEVHKGGKETTLYVGPKTGKTERQSVETDIHESLPPSDGRPLSEIIKSLEDQKLGVISQADFNNGAWEVEVHKDGKRFRLSVDAKSGMTKENKHGRRRRYARRGDPDSKRATPAVVTQVPN